MKMKFDDYVEYLAHMLDEAMVKEDKEQDSKGSSESEKKESNKKKNPKEALYKALKTMRPGQVMDFVAKQLGLDVPKFLMNNAGHIAGLAAKNGWAKANGIKDAFKELGSKNKEDNSGIDWENVDVDEDTFQFKCLFDGDSGNKFKEFMKQYESEMKDLKVESEEADKQFHDDVKKAGVKIDDEKLDQNGIVVASVIDDKENKKLKGKELTKKVDDAIEKDKNVEKLIKKTKDSKKALKKVKVDSKYDKMSDDELEKKMKELEEEMKKRKEKGKQKKKEKVKESEVNESLLNEKLSKDPTDHLAVSFLNCVKKLSRSNSTARRAATKQWELWVRGYMKDTGIKMSYADVRKVISGKMTTGDNALDAMCSMFSDLEDSEPKDVINDLNGLLSDKDLMNGYGDKFKKAIAYAGKFKGNDIFEISNAVDSSKDILKNIDSEEAAQDAVKKLVKAGKSTEEAQEEVMSKIKGADWYKDLDGDAKDELTDKLGLEADRVSTGLEADVDAAGIPDGPSDNFGKVPTGFAVMPDGSKVPSFSYSTMSKQISDLDDIFDDGKVTPEELAKLNGMATKLDSYVEWAAENKDSNDPNVQMKIATIKRLTSKYNDLVDNNASNLDSSTDYFNGEQGAARLSLPKDVNGKAIADTAKSDTMAQAKEGWKEKLGIGKAFTALGWARLAAKTTGIILNHGKDLINVIDAQAMKNREDKSVIAEIRCIMTNGEGSDSKFSDSKFSVRFSIDDFKWHATNLDDRKMKLPEDIVVKKILNSELGKKFKAACLKKWKNIIQPEDKTKNVIPYILKNYEKLGLKVSGDAKKMLDTVNKVLTNFGKIEKQFS